METEERERASNSERTYEKAKASKFHFKFSSKRRHKDSHANNQDRAEKSASERHRSDRYDYHERIHRKSKRRREKHHDRASENEFKTSTRNGEYYDPDHRQRESLYDNLDNAGLAPNPVESEEAFRESLFDALADDEGAAYWEGVYGQPVHVYPDTKTGPNGTLERMSEEEYADYVRKKMWEKTHQHIVEEREARERARKKRKEQKQLADEEMECEEAEREDMRRRMEESLRRGEKRRKAREAEKGWSDYLERWEVLKNNRELADVSAFTIQDIIPWPVLGLKANRVSAQAIEEFLRAAHGKDEDFNAMLKAERVRWHPDKMQQRFGQHIDSDTMRLVTAVFQVIDRLWNAHR